MCEEGDIRLVDGASELEGRVEVCLRTQDVEWGTVCDDHWIDQNSAVICRQLGFSPSGMHVALNQL